LRARERSTQDLIHRDPDEPMVRQFAGRFRQELHERFLNPIYGLVFGMIAFAALCQPKTTRQGRGLALGCAIMTALAMRIAGFGTSGMMVRNENAIWLAYGMPLALFCLALAYALKPDLFSALWYRPSLREQRQ
jgi:lipopolysaccharide export system permease protein